MVRRGHASAGASARCGYPPLWDRGITRLLELREYDEGYEQDIALAEFTYDGREGFWTSGGMEWMVYASHESSITFGGAWLIGAMRKCLPDFDRFLYRGWDLSQYDLEDNPTA